MPDDWFDGGGNGRRCDVEALLDSDAGAAIHGVVALGALVSLGTTADGGALGVTITVDGRWRREYFRDVDELGLWLAEAMPAVRDAVEASAASSGRGARKRSARGL
jgi:hypothetical protein